MENKFQNSLDIIAKSYDIDIEYGRKGINLYENLPEHITNDPDYPKWETELENGTGGSEDVHIKDYLLPDTNMKYIDLGCSLNLMFKGYNKWLSTYHGVDISSETIKLLNDFVANNELAIGSLYCGSIHETPFDDNYFDIGACIGVLEYFEKDFVEKAIIEVSRIIKPNGKFVLDIPNITSPTGRIMMLIEGHLGRPDKFNMLPQEFEDMLNNYFEIDEKNGHDAESMGIRYYLRCKNI